ncbi:hypothetical protein [Marivita sp. S0852]|uniref:hypothetical protein n=1 Tax=Marivita sp. S0852 TaxID=3373893 RepID=UPI003982980C
MTGHKRQHDFAAAVPEYHRIRTALGPLGYTAFLVPRLSVHDRLKLVLDACR